MSQPVEIAILEDSEAIRNMLVTGLETAGFATTEFTHAFGLEKYLKSKRPDLCIVDLGLPDRDGLGLVHRITSELGIPVLIVSGRNATQDKITGLELGADDYITKPFELAEVIARVRALLRRRENSVPNTQSGIVEFSGWQVDLDRLTLTAPNREPQGLSLAEAKLLAVFLSAPNRLITREQMLVELGIEASDNFDRAMDVRVSRLRAKLNDDPQNPKIIKTIYGAGYIFIGAQN